MKGIKNENDGKKSLQGIRRNGIRRNRKTPLRQVGASRLVEWWHAWSTVVWSHDRFKPCRIQFAVGRPTCACARRTQSFFVAVGTQCPPILPRSHCTTTAYIIIAENSVKYVPPDGLAFRFYKISFWPGTRPGPRPLGELKTLPQTP